MMPTVILNATEEMLVMQEEIFGPIMPIKTYNQIDEVVDYVNMHERPLGLYYFGNKKSEEDFVMSNTVSGGAALNDVIFQFIQEDLPFGGHWPKREWDITMGLRVSELSLMREVFTNKHH